MFGRTTNRRILVVDDDLDTLGLIRMVFQRAGHDVSTATCWEEVADRINLAKQTGNLFDLIILDLMMPERSGFDVLDSLKVVLEKVPPVIILSAKYTVDDMVKASDMGVAKYLVKPTTPEKLLDAVQMVLSQPH